jgi:hypothetical protein
VTGQSTNSLQLNGYPYNVNRVSTPSDRKFGFGKQYRCTLNQARPSPDWEGRAFNKKNARVICLTWVESPWYLTKKTELWVKQKVDIFLLPLINWHLHWSELLINRSPFQYWILAVARSRLATQLYHPLCFAPSASWSLAPKEAFLMKDS